MFSVTWFSFVQQFIALYNYNPIENSPNPNPANELEFQEGDIIRVLDVSRPDGFYLGKVCFCLFLCLLVCYVGLYVCMFAFLEILHE